MIDTKPSPVSTVTQCNSFSVTACVCVHLQGCQLAQSKIVPVYKLSSRGLFPGREIHKHVCTDLCCYCFMYSVCLRAARGLCGRFMSRGRTYASSDHLFPILYIQSPPSFRHTLLVIISVSQLSLPSPTPKPSSPVISNPSSLLSACLPVTPFLCE